MQAQTPTYRKCFRCQGWNALFSNQGECIPSKDYHSDRQPLVTCASTDCRYPEYFQRKFPSKPSLSLEAETRNSMNVPNLMLNLAIHQPTFPLNFHKPYQSA